MASRQRGGPLPSREAPGVGTDTLRERDRRRTSHLFRSLPWKETTNGMNCAPSGAGHPLRPTIAFGDMHSGGRDSILAPAPTEVRSQRIPRLERQRERFSSVGYTPESARVDQPDRHRTIATGEYTRNLGLVGSTTATPNRCQYCGFPGRLGRGECPRHAVW